MIMLWLAKKFGTRHVWQGPKIYGVGYQLGSTIYFDPVEDTPVARIMGARSGAGVSAGGAVVLAVSGNVEGQIESTPHEWVTSHLGHGNLMCLNCLITDLEAEAIGVMNSCDAVPKLRDTVKFESIAE